MNRFPQTIRKAAILVSSLDSETADTLLAQMDARQADAVRRAVMDLGSVDSHEQQDVIGQFVRGRATSSPNGVELDGSLARHFSPTTSSPADIAADRVKQDAPPRGKPFQFLDDVEHDHLAGHLQAEHPQTIAVVLSHLPPQRAAHVVSSLPTALQTDVLGRLADLDHTDPVIVREVEQGLMSRLAEGWAMRPAARGVSAVAEILRETPSRGARLILDNIQRHNERLGRHLTRRQVSFADVEALDDESLRVVFAAAKPELAKLALVGADALLSDRVIGLLPKARADSLIHAMRLLGPTPLSDLEDAQQELANIALDLEAEGRIDLPNTVHCV